MKYIPNAVSRKVARQILIGRKNSPTILFTSGVVGVVTTTVLACRATLKLDEALVETQDKMEQAKVVLDSPKHNYSEKDYRQDMTYLYIRGAVKVTKLYGPAIIVGVISIAALTGSHKILTGRNAALTAAYAAVEKGFAQYRQRVVEEFGEDKDRELRYSAETVTLVEDTKNGPKKVDVKRVGPHGASVYAKFFDQLCPSWSPTPEINRLFLQCQQNYANDLLHARGHIFLNEVYDMIGVDRTTAGQVVGWVMSKKGDNFVDFGIFDRDNHKARDFVNGREGAILLDFNVDGPVYEQLDRI